MKIPIEEIEFHPNSFADRNGRVFIWKGELYRAISQQGSDICKRIFNEGIVKRLVDKNLLIESELTDLSLNGFYLVVKHRRLPFISYPFEWSAGMIRDAVLLIADLEIELARYGLTLVDADPFNLLFDGCSPVYVDLGSIGEARKYQKMESDFIKHCLFPLKLIASEQSQLARLLWQDSGSLLDDFAELNQTSMVLQFKDSHLNRVKLLAKKSLDNQFHPFVKKVLATFKQPSSKSVNLTNSPRMDRMLKLRKVAETLMTPLTITAEKNITKSTAWTKKKNMIKEIFERSRPETALIIGIKGTLLTDIIVNFAKNVVIVDADDKSVDKIFYDAKSQNVKVLPLVVDIRYPSPGFGVCNAEYLPAIARLASDIVLAVDLVHNLILKWHLTFEHISQILFAITKRWLVVEFISPRCKELRKLISDPFYSWYDLTNFTESLRKCFTSVKIYNSCKDEKFLLYCEK